MMKKELPEGWEWKIIADIGNKQKNAIVDGPFGSNLKLSDYVDDGEIPVITITNIEQGYANDKLRYISKSKFDSLKRSAVKPGDIIMAKIGASYGKCGFYPDDLDVGIIPANMIKISVSEDVDKKYVYFFFQSSFFKEKLTSITKTTAQPAFNMSAFKELPIPLPPLKTQRKIVAILEKAEATQRLRAEADALTQELVQSVFLEMFGDPVTNQMGWEIQNINQCMEKIIDYRGKTPQKTDCGIPLITAKLIKNGKILTPNEFISPYFYDQWMSRGFPEKGDVIFTTEGPLGEVAQIVTDEKIALAQRVLTLRGNPEVIDNTFLAYELRSKFIEKQLNQLSTGSTVKGIRQSEFRKINIFIPPLVYQKKFLLIAKNIENSQIIQQNQQSEIMNLFDNITTKAFTGELIA